MHYNRPSHIKTRIMPYKSDKRNETQESKKDLWEKEIAREMSQIPLNRRPNAHRCLQRSFSQDMLLHRTACYISQGDISRGYTVAGKTANSFVSANVSKENEKNIVNSGKERITPELCHTPRRFSLGFKRQQIKPVLTPNRRKSLVVPKISVKDCSSSARDVDERFYRREYEKAARFMEMFYADITRQNTDASHTLNSVETREVIAPQTGQGKSGVSDALCGITTEKNLGQRSQSFIETSRNPEQKRWAVWKVVKDYFSTGQ